jgi:hypothetical protein
MTTIVAGEFPTLEDAQVAIEALHLAGVGEEDCCTFAVNPPGQHDQFAIGGDSDESPGAEHAEKVSAEGAAAGAVVGAAIGFVGGPVGAAAGAAIGAYSGSLVGALHGLHASPKAGQVRQAGVLVAVNAANAKPGADALARLLHETGAQPVERLDGRWSDGEWADFDPVRRPQPIYPVNS